MKKEGKYYTTQDNLISCNLCPHNCKLNEGQHGICGIREASEGSLYTLNYGEISSIGLDPIEKKPLFHFKPGKIVLSVGSFGCNFSCSFCQNYSISKNLPKTQYVAPEALIDEAGSRISDGNVGIAFTYNEPSIWYEYVYDVAQLCSDKNLDMILVTNGYINLEPLKDLLPYISAMNIDLKAFNNHYYRTVCGGDVDSVLNTISTADSKCHVEITTLLVNGYNDSDEEVKGLSKKLSEINKSMPLHLSRYYPTYKMDAPATPIDRVISCRDVAKKYLQYVYVGNIANVENNTYCHKCNNLLIERTAYDVNVYIKEPICPKCSEKINIIL
ncbi:MAG: AmmeMemoRadiSam system radical SAM enzyme [Bacillota bacterium]|nr:AmmeMemoRadiSam system radical SAM enzyme [Bacillota bacterium]